MTMTEDDAMNMLRASALGGLANMRKARSELFSNVGRPLEELLKTKEQLSGAESQRLRSWFSSECMEPARDLDEYGRLLWNGDLQGVQADYQKRVDALVADDPDATDATYVHREVAAEQLYDLTWGPTGVRIYGMLLLARHLKVEKAASHLAITKWLIETAGVLIDGRDLSGTTALSHSISTKPSFDSALAELLVGAGGDVNAQNRYGGTAGHEICTAYEDRKARKALDWFMSHGGNVDIRDGDGATARLSVTAGPWRGLKDVLKNEDWRRKRAEGTICSFCGRNDLELMLCTEGCGKARYCTSRRCQKGDKAHHSATCKAK